MKTKPTTEKMLTELELEIMNRIWDGHPCTVRDVVNRLGKSKALAYTSVATMMKILEEKGFLESQKGERTHLYAPCIAKEEYETRALKHVAQKLFNGNPASMVAKLLNEAEISADDLKRIRTILKERDRS